ncbi:MAG: KOW motif-containing protein [Muribaculaceae bacterium]|nr:KOW motif-containing protein [Muribaculaceae bacterium]
MTTHWYAIKTHQDFRAEDQLRPQCEDLLFPKEEIVSENRKSRTRAVIPRVLFIKTTREKALQLELEGRRHPELSVPFWIYRYPQDNRIQEISSESIRLLRLLTAQDSTRCEIFTKKDFKEGEKVRVIGGPFKGYEGTVTRVKRDRHVIVRIEGICLIMLPFIHPDLLQPIPEEK